MKRKYIFKIFCIFLLIVILGTTKIFSKDTQENIIEEQQNNFGIKSFIENSKEYTGDFFENIDINEILNSAIKGEVNNSIIYKRIMKIFGTEVQNGIKNIVIILVIIIIHSILKSISDSLENNNINKIIYYVQYIAIVTIIMSNFSDIINMVKTATTNLVGFMNMLIPILISIMIYTGNIATSNILEPIILFMINFIGNIIQDVLIPIIMIMISITIVSRISDKVKVEKISKFLKSGTTYFLATALTIFVGIVSLEGSLASSVDGITAKTAKTIVSSAVPIVGKILGDVVDSVIGCGNILKNSVGFIGVVIILGICIIPIIKISILTISYKIVAAIGDVIADEKIVSLIDQIADIFKILLAILTSIAVMVIIGITIFIKMSAI